MKYFSFSAFNTLRSLCARLPCFIPEAILLIGCQALLGCCCVVKLLSVNTAQRAHDWASSILIHTHTGVHILSQTHTRKPHRIKSSSWSGGCWTEAPFYPLSSPPWPLRLRHVYMAPSVSQVTQSGVQLPPNHRHHHHPRSKLQDGSQTLIVCSNNICTFHIMAVLKSSLCSKCSGEVRGSLSPERPFR